MSASAGALRELLASFGLEQLAETFIANGIDAGLIPDLKDDDLREMGLSLGDRKRVARMRDALVASQSTRRTTQRRAEAERRQITVLFADLVGSTALSVQLDPEDLRSVLRAFHEAVEAAVKQFDGYVAQHLGDGAVVYFGWPTAHEDDAERAVRAALDLVDLVRRAKSPAPKALETRVGVATGLVVVGDLLENVESLERPVIGETPNLAARLQGLAEPGGIVISDTTLRVAGDLFKVTDLGTTQLKGFDAPVRAWRVDGERVVTSRFAALRGSDLSTLVGRELETSTLAEAWAEVKLGSARIAHLIGEPGIGKSRLVGWVRDLVASDGGVEHLYFCSPYHGGSALYPLIRHLESAADFRPDDDGTTRWNKLAVLADTDGLTGAHDLPVVAKLLNIALPPTLAPPRLEPIQEKEIVLSAAVRRLGHVSAKSPVMVVMEDLHWSDPSTNELIERMLIAADGHPVFFLACYRPEYTPSWPTDGHIRLELGRLAMESSREIMKSLSADMALDDATIARIVARTDGIPLFVEELTKTMIESRASSNGPGDDRLERPIPETLHDSLLSRLDRLGSVKQVAQVAACVGREFSGDLLHSLLDLPERELADALARLVDSDLVRRENGPSGIAFVFKHALVQDAAYESLLKSRRATIHGRIATKLEADDGEAPPEILAYHFGRAGVLLKEADNWLRAGQRALSRTAFLEAIQHFSAGLNAVSRLPSPDPARELALQVLRAVPLTLTRGWAAPEVGVAYERAQDLCNVLGGSPETFPTLVGIFTYRLVRGEMEYAYELAKSNADVALASGDDALIMEAVHDRGTSSLYRGLLPEAELHLSRASALFDPAKHAHHKFLYNKLAGPTADVHLMMAQATRGDTASARRGYARAQANAEAADHAFTKIWVKTGHCIFLRHTRELAELASTAQSMISESQELGFPNWLAQGLAWAGWAQAKSGDPETGVATIRQGLAIWSMTGARLMIPYLTITLMDALVMAGQVEEAEGVYEELLRAMDETNERWCEAEAHRVGAQIARLRLGHDAHEASDRATRALNIARERSQALYEIDILHDLVRSAAGDVSPYRSELARALEPFADNNAPVFAEARASLASRTS